MDQQGHQRYSIINGSHLYYGDTIGPFVPFNVTNNVNYEMMSVPYGPHGGNQLRTSVPQMYAYVQDGHFILNHQVNHVSTRRFIEPAQRQYNISLGRNQLRMSTPDVVSGNVYVQDDQLIFQQNNIDQALIRNQPRMSTSDIVSGNIYVQDGHLIFQQNNIDQFSIRNQHRVSTSDVVAGNVYDQDGHLIFQQNNIDQTSIRNQPRASTSNIVSGNVYVQDDHLIFQENNVNQTSIQNQHRMNTPGIVSGNIYNQDDHLIFQQNNIDQVSIRNQPRVNTPDIVSGNIYVQDDHLIFQQNNINQTSVRRDIEATQTRSIINLKRIIIEDGKINSEPITCSICLMGLSNKLVAIQLPSPCSHVYHEDCIMNWLDRSNTCPLCRRSIS
ncbi:hypothetical protein RYX36_007331 [Vicia faba]